MAAAVSAPHAAAVSERPGPFFALQSVPVVGVQTLTFTLMYTSGWVISKLFFIVEGNSVSTLTGLLSSDAWTQLKPWVVYTAPFALEPGEVTQAKVRADLQYTSTYPAGLEAGIGYGWDRDPYLRYVNCAYA